MTNPLQGSFDPKGKVTQIFRADILIVPEIKPVFIDEMPMGLVGYKTKVRKLPRILMVQRSVSFKNKVIDITTQTHLKTWLSRLILNSQLV